MYSFIATLFYAGLVLYLDIQDLGHLIHAEMPDKFYKKGCGPSCLKCWSNRLKHANPTTKKYMKKHAIVSIDANAMLIRAEKVATEQTKIGKYRGSWEAGTNTRTEPL